MAENPSKQEFEDYLSWLDVFLFWLNAKSFKERPSFSFAEKQLNDNDSLLLSFAGSLQNHVQQQNEQKEDLRKTELENLRTTLKEKYWMYLAEPNFVEFWAHIEKTFKTMSSNDKKCKGDVFCTASIWTWEHFQRHLDTIFVRFVEPEPGNGVLDCHFLPHLQEHYKKLATVYLGAADSTHKSVPEDRIPFLALLRDHTFGEATSRVFIDALLLPILHKNSCKVRLEEKLYIDGLPYCIADYVVYNKDDEILGVVEAKAVGSFTSVSVIQCMLQLLALRAKVAHKLFSIVTDGICYLCLTLTPDGFFEFERSRTHNGTYVLERWSDLRQVAAMINRALNIRDRSVPANTT